MSSENDVEKNQKTSPWPLLDHMSFIWSFIIHRRRYAVNTIKSEPKTYQAIAPKRDGEEWTIALDCNNESQGVDDKIELESPRQKRQKLLPHQVARKQRIEEPERLFITCRFIFQEQSIEESPDVYQVSDDTRSYTQRTEHCINSQSYVADEQHYFCMSVAETLRRFTQRQSAEAKLKIQQILYEIEFGDANTTFEDAFIDPQ